MMVGKGKCSLLLLLSFLWLYPDGLAQKLGLEPFKWATELAKAELTEENSMGSLHTQLLQADSSIALKFLDTLERTGQDKGYFFRTHFSMVKAKYLFEQFAGYDRFKDYCSNTSPSLKAQIMLLHTDAIEAAYHTEDQLTIGWATFYSAKLMRHLGETGRAVMYSKNGVDLFEKVGYSVEPTVYASLSELLYEVREYEESFANAKKAMKAWETATDSGYNTVWGEQYRIRTLNILALNYFVKKHYDSSLANLQLALKKAEVINDTLWTGKVGGNMGKVLLKSGATDPAYNLFKTEYSNCMAAGVYHQAADAISWAAKANLARGNASAALLEAKSALELLALSPNRTFLSGVYLNLSKIFRAVKKYDSAFYYNDRYMALQDSLEKEIATSSIAISKGKLNDEVSRFNIQKNHRDREAALLWRNVIIGFIIAFAIFALVVLNRQLLAEKLKIKQIEKDKLILEQEMLAASVQLNMFTGNIIEKNNLIARLELEMINQQDTATLHSAISTLAQFTILTEKDWSKFKILYEKVYPGFFRNLMAQFPEITIAEQRMAALCKLRLSTQEKASMLGISVDSVRKSNQRLRLRTLLANDISLEDYFANWGK